jgi:hypothetical protein
MNPRFEAVWKGDSTTVKALTSSVGDKSKEPPLHIGVKDGRSFTPLAIAVLRGNIEMVKLIMEIAESQYSPPTKNRRRIRMPISNESGESDNNDSYDSDDDFDGEDNPAKERTTVDVREIQPRVSSRMHPLTLLRSRGPLWRNLENWSSYAKDRMKRPSDRFVGPSAAVSIADRPLEIDHDMLKFRKQKRVGNIKLYLVK